jgi:hypothetical protein
MEISFLDDDSKSNRRKEKISMKIKFSDIKITDGFAATIPSESKLEECRYNYNTYGKIDRWIVVDNTNTLIDGYIAYLVMKENGYTDEEIQVKQSNIRKKRWYRKNTENWSGLVQYKRIPTIYVYGKHHEDGKEYVWRIPETKRELASEIVIGGNALVNTKHGNKVIMVTKVKELSECPVDGRVKKVIRW